MTTHPELTFTFDRNYRNVEQVRPFMPAYLARYDELKRAGRYPYNNDFRGHLGITGDEDTAIYLCQTLRSLDEIAEKVAAALNAGWVPVTSMGQTPLRCASVIHYGQFMGGTGWHEWRDVRLVPAPNGGLAVMAKRARTRGHLLLGGHVLAKFA